MLKKGGFFKPPSFIEVADLDYEDADGGKELLDLFGYDIAESIDKQRARVNMLELTPTDYFGNSLAQKEDLINIIYIHAIRNLFRFLATGTILNPDIVSKETLLDSSAFVINVQRANTYLNNLSDNDMLGKKIKQVIAAFVTSVTHWIDNYAHKITGENIPKEVFDKYSYQNVK